MAKNRKEYRLPSNIDSYEELKTFVLSQGVKVVELTRKTKHLCGRVYHDEERIEIYPLAFKDKIEFETLLHEYIHMFLGKGFGHRSLFKRLAISYGFKSKYITPMEHK